VYDVGLWSVRYRLLVLSFASLNVLLVASRRVLFVGHLFDALADRRDWCDEEDLFLL
jgi:hypothetical protein